MTINGKGEVGIARGGDKAEAIARSTGDSDYSQRSQGSAEVTTLTIDESRIGGRYKPGRWSRDVVPVGEGDDGGFVIDIVATHYQYFVVPAWRNGALTD